MTLAEKNKIIQMFYSYVRSIQYFSGYQIFFKINTFVLHSSILYYAIKVESVSSGGQAECKERSDSLHILYIRDTGQLCGIKLHIIY